MFAAIVCVVLCSGPFDLIGESSSFDLIGGSCRPTDFSLLNEPKEEETEDEAIPECPYVKNGTLVHVYLDLDDGDSVRRISKDCGEIEGIVFSFRDKSRIPAAGRDYLSNGSYKLPLLHYHTDRGWVFQAGWPGSLEFAQRWSAANAGSELLVKDQGVSQRQSPANHQGQVANYPIRNGWWTGCDGWRHMTQGVHAGKYDPAWLQALSWDELQSLHSDDHEGRVKQSYVNRYAKPAPVAALSSASPAPRKKRSGAGFVRQQFYCPSGNCPWARG